MLLAGFALALMAGEAEADDLGTPMLTGGENWTEVADEPAEVGDGALSVNWDKTDVVMRGTVVVVSGGRGLLAQLHRDRGGKPWRYLQVEEQRQHLALGDR